MRAAWIPSHVEAILIRTRDLSIPIDLYSYTRSAHLDPFELILRRTSMMCRALSTEPLVSKENRASTSVETFPGTIFKISLPNSTKRRSRVASTFSSSVLPCFIPYSIATSWSLAYSVFFDAARIREGFVVASWGLYLPMAVECQFCIRGFKLKI